MFSHNAVHILHLYIQKTFRQCATAISLNERKFMSLTELTCYYTLGQNLFSICIIKFLFPYGFNECFENISIQSLKIMQHQTKFCPNVDYLATWLISICIKGPILYLTYCFSAHLVHFANKQSCISELNRNIVWHCWIEIGSSI